MASSLQLASSPRQYRLTATDQQTPSDREQPVEVPHLDCTHTRSMQPLTPRYQETNKRTFRIKKDASASAASDAIYRARRTIAGVGSARSSFPLIVWRLAAEHAVGVGRVGKHHGRDYHAADDHRDRKRYRGRKQAVLCMFEMYVLSRCCQATVLTRATIG